MDPLSFSHARDSATNGPRAVRRPGGDAVLDIQELGISVADRSLALLGSARPKVSTEHAIAGFASIALR